ncbi:MAG TPA: STAS domain-containing protein [bacterium]|nr:STAS domain-containing protein [bacterium]
MEGISVEMNDYSGNKKITVISVKGQLDTTTAHALEDQLKLALQDKKFNLIIELKDVDYISSAGWGIFISELKRIRTAKGDLVLAGMKPEVSEIFELLEFNRIIKSFDDLENAAMKAFPNLPKATRVAKRLRPLFSTEG